MTTEFKAYAKDCHLTRATPQAAALAFFETFPNKRKCNIIQGVTDGPFFTVTYGRKSSGNWPQSWKNVTKKTALNLPDEVTS